MMRAKPWIVAGLLLAGTLLFAPPAAAWSAFGHRLVAQLAYNQLSAPVRRQVDALLALEPGADIASIAPWPDEIRKQPGYERTGPFHYVNFPQHSCRYDAARDCPDGACIVAALPRYIDTLGDANRSDPERLEALKFVVHLVGDAHQPLHAGNRPDRGGNRFQIQLQPRGPGKSEGTNLHAVWDYHILRSAERDMRQWLAALEPAVAAATTGNGDVREWAEASCALLDQEHLYPARPGKLSQAWLEQKRPIAEHQIVLAAARLAKVLERALKN